MRQFPEYACGCGKTFATFVHNGINVDLTLMNYGKHGYWFVVGIARIEFCTIHIDDLGIEKPLEVKPEELFRLIMNKGGDLIDRWWELLAQETKYSFEKGAHSAQHKMREALGLDE